MAEYAVSKLAYENDTFKLKDYRNAGVYYGTCATAAATKAKVVTCANFTLASGAIIFVKFTYGQTYNGAPTLNVNSTGAKSVKSVGTTDSVRYSWLAGEVVGFVYDGTNFVIIDGGIATEIYYGVTKLSSATDSTSTSLAATPAAVKAAYDLASTAYAKVPTPSSADVGKSLIVTALGKYILSDGTNHTVTMHFDNDYYPGDLYIEEPNGTKYHGDSEELSSFSILDGDIIKCYVDYSSDDNIITLNGTTVSGAAGGEAYYELKVTGNVSITCTANPGSYGRIAITAQGASKGVELSNTSSYPQYCYVDFNGTHYYTQGDTITIPAGGTLRCYANCGPNNYLYVNGTQVVGGSGALDYDYTVSTDISVQFDISIASYGAIRITTT